MPPAPPTPLPALFPLAETLRASLVATDTATTNALNALGAALAARSTTATAKDKLLAISQLLTELSRTSDSLQDRARTISILAGDADKAL